MRTPYKRDKIHSLMRHYHYSLCRLKSTYGVLLAYMTDCPSMKHRPPGMCKATPVTEYVQKVSNRRKDQLANVEVLPAINYYENKKSLSTGEPENSGFRSMQLDGQLGQQGFTWYLSFDCLLEEVL